MKAQGATEYLVIVGVVLAIALVCVALLVWPVETTKDAKKQQTDVHFKIAAMEYPDLLQGLVAYWKFDDGSGISATDSRGTATGTLTNGPAWTTNAKSGKAVVFDGTNDYVTYGSPAALNLPTTRTVVAWVKTENSQRNTIVNKGTQYWVIIEAGNQVYYYYWGAVSGAWRIYNTPAAITPGVWTHIAVVEDTSWSMPKIYVNGTEMALTGNPTREANSGSSTTLYAGGYQGANYNFNGTIDELMIFNRALSAGEVRLLYENPGYPQ
ncbi:Concanavalin A-like lectin/glucanases superfamily protein [Candidatus Anstonella stagnisolia]|nr:Concanavalin A-like lectin/glucanases superfamily protein [Candidatus Anstonella stagnisolia]